jgi:CheY-like chemotaxis protein
MEHKKTILVVEDERQLAMAIREAFIARGFEPYIVATVEDGIKQLENLKNIDVIWLDHYLLGSGNGLDFVVQVKNHENWKNIPIFVVSNTASTTNIRSYLQLGVTNYYTKADYDINQIITDIEYALNNKL